MYPRQWGPRVALLAGVIALVYAWPRLALRASPEFAGLPYGGAGDGERYVLTLLAWTDPAQFELMPLKFGGVQYTEWGNSVTMLVGTVLRALGLGPDAFIPAADCVLPAVAACLWFAVGRAFTGSARAGLAAAACGFLVPTLGDWQHAWPPTLRVPLGVGLPWGRPINPQVSGQLWILGLLLIHRADAKPGWGIGAVLAVTWAAAGYVYGYVWALLMCTAGVAFLARVALRDWRRAGMYAVACIAGLVPAVGHLLALARKAGDAAGTATSAQTYETERFLHLTVHSWLLLALAATIGHFLFHGRTRDDDLGEQADGDPAARWVVPMAALLAFPIGANVQMVTGFTLQPHHFDWFYGTPLVFLGVAWLAVVLDRGREPFAFLPGGARLVGCLIAALGAACLVPQVGRVVMGAVPGWGEPGVARLALFGGSFLVAGGAVVLAFARRWDTRRDVLLVALCVPALWVGVGTQRQAIHSRVRLYQNLQGLEAAFTAIDAHHGGPGAVVATEPRYVAEILAAHSRHQDLVGERHHMYGEIAREEAHVRARVLCVLFGVTPDEFRPLIREGLLKVTFFGTASFEGAPRSKLVLGEPPPLPESALDAQVAAYEELWRGGPEAALALRPVDYLLFDAIAAKTGFRSPGELGLGELVHAAGGIEVYALPPR